MSWGAAVTRSVRSTSTRRLQSGLPKTCAPTALLLWRSRSMSPTGQPSRTRSRRSQRSSVPVHVLVTSAGLVGFAPFTEISPAAWARMIDVNLTGTFHCCQVAVPDMVNANWGRIVMISSSSAQRGSPLMAHYAASKGAVIALTKSLAREYASAGITVNNIPPSGIETPMQHQSQAEGKLPSNEQMAQSIPIGHLGTGDDIAAMVGFLSSPEAGFITGRASASTAAQ